MLNETFRFTFLALALTACGADEAADAPPPTPVADAPPPELVVEQEAPAAAQVEPAAAPAPDGEDHCAAAYDEVQAMIRQLQEQLGPGNGSRGPSRADFVAGCRELPAGVQPCMRMSYAMEHQAECQQARDGLDDETRARVQRLMGR